MILDVRTMGIVSAVTPFILGVAMLIYQRERNVYGGFMHWVLADFGLCAGYLLVSFRGFIPDFLSIVLSNGIIVYCCILIYEGIERFNERPAFRRLNYVVLGVYLLLQAVFTYRSPNINARILLSSFALGFLILRSAAVLFQTVIPQLARLSRSAGYVFLVTAFFLSIRAFLVLLSPEPIDFFADNLNSWFSTVIIISIVMWNFHFFFLNSSRRELDLEAARRELHEIASTDPLTRLYNRRHFNEHAEMEFTRAKRYGHSLSFLVVDADGFKAINDSYGHEAGDAILASLSAVLRMEVRSFDLVARLGGDEFVIMLVHADRNRATSIAERIRDMVERNAIAFGSHVLRICVSVGVTTVEPADTDAGMTLRRGDAALYLAKQQGRNRVVCA